MSYLSLVNIFGRPQESPKIYWRGSECHWLWRVSFNEKKEESYKCGAAFFSWFRSKNMYLYIEAKVNVRSRNKMEWPKFSQTQCQDHSFCIVRLCCRWRWVKGCWHAAASEPVLIVTPIPLQLRCQSERIHGGSEPDFDITDLDKTNQQQDP